MKVNGERLAQEFADAHESKGDLLKKEDTTKWQKRIELCSLQVVT